jgi:hypothetical protein
MREFENERSQELSFSTESTVRERLKMRGAKKKKALSFSTESTVEERLKMRGAECCHFQRSLPGEDQLN